MLKRMAPVLLCLVPLIAGSGCVESKSVITLNADGKGKMQLDVLMPSPSAADFGGPKPKDLSLDDQRNQAVAKMLTDAKGVTAWKDVTAEWNADGRLHFVATAYFDKLDKVEIQPIPLPTFQVVPEKAGVLKLTGKFGNKDNPVTAPDTKPLPDPKKLSDKELDEEILKQRIGYQASRPMLVGVFTDYKATTTFNLPGKAGDAKGFAKEGDKVARHELVGGDVIKAIDGVMKKDTATLRKMIRDSGTLKSLDTNQLEQFADIPASMNPSVTVTDATKDIFDYDKEMKQARDGSAALREKFKVDSKKPWPWEHTGSGSPPPR
jgi:hypothetical protein